MSNLRRLPFNGPDGKPAYTPDDNPGGHLASLADKLEDLQLTSAREVLRLASQSAHLDESSAGELRWVVQRVCEALSDTLAVADSRGQRL